MFGLPFGMLFAAVQALQTSLMVGGDAGLAVFAMTSGMSAVFAAQRLRDRYVLARVGALVAGVNVLVVLGLALWQASRQLPRCWRCRWSPAGSVASSQRS